SGWHHCAPRGRAAVCSSNCGARVAMAGTGAVVERTEPAAPSGTFLQRVFRVEHRRFLDCVRGAIRNGAGRARRRVRDCAPNMEGAGGKRGYGALPGTAETLDTRDRDESFAPAHPIPGAQSLVLDL